MKRFDFKRIASMLLLILAMAFGVSPLAAQAADVWSVPTSAPSKPFAKGSGTAKDPYLISSAQELANLAYMVTVKDEYYEGKYFRQTCNIVLNDNLVTKEADGTIVAGNGISQAKPWSPIGDHGTFWDDKFMGIYDGDHHSISGIYCNDMSASNANYVGLFARTEDARISNLTIKDSYICPSKNNKKEACIGALVGMTRNTSITNCHVENTTVQTSVISYDSFFYPNNDIFVEMGGLVGYFETDSSISGVSTGLITGCSFDGYITLNTTCKRKIIGYVAGIIGEYKAVTNGFATTELYATDCTSKGLIRGIKSENYSIEYSSYYAGIIGYLSTPNHLFLEKCCNFMTIQVPQPTTYKPQVATERISGIANVYSSNKETAQIRQCANLGTFEYNGSEKEEYYINGLFYRNSQYTKEECKIEDCASYSKITVNGTVQTGEVNGVTNRECTVKNLVCTSDVTTNNKTGLTTFSPIPPKESTVEQCYYHATLDNEERTSDVNGATKKTLEELKATATLEALNGSSENTPIWGFYQGEGNYQGYPLPIGCGGTLNNLPGKGTATEPYLINNENDLRKFAVGINNGSFGNTADTHYALNANIYMNDASTELPTIGISEHPFLATFDGNGYQIANLKKISDALFGEMQGTIKNLALTHYSLTASSSAYEGSAIAKNVGSADGKNTGNIENCYVTGDINLSTSQNAYFATAGGICLTVNPDSKVSNCYFYGEINVNKNVEEPTVGSICSSNSNDQGTMSNCYGIVTNEDVQSKLANITGVHNCKDDADAQQFSGHLGDNWINGYYHPILKDAYHYECTDPDGNVVGLDPITTIVPDNNDILCLEPSTKNMDDATMWKMPNVAVYTLGYDAYMLANATLVDGKPLRFKPASGHENAPVKGLMNYHFQPESWQMLCLPGEVKLSDLPEGSKLYIGGTLNTEANPQKMNLVEVEAIPAGVPFIAYIGPAITAGNESIDITMTGDLMMTPQTQEGSSLMGTFTPISSQSDICSSISNNGQYLTPGTEVKPFRAYVNSSQEIGLTDYLLLDEQSYDIEDIINAYATTDAAAPKTVNIKMRRKIQAGGWNTLCLPFSLSADEVKKYFGEDCKLEELSDVTSNSGSEPSSNAEGPSLIMKFKTATEVEAGKPYILKVATAPTSDIYDFGARTLTKDTEPKIFPGIQIGNDLSVNFDMMGSYPMVYMFSDVNASRFFIQQNTIYRATEEAPVIMNGFRCYLKAENMSSQTAESLSARMIHGDGSTTSLKLTTVGNQQNGSRIYIYDLQGVEHTTMQRGINIVGGKKIIKK